jgi:hypothetical protein
MFRRNPLHDRYALGARIGFFAPSTDEYGRKRDDQIQQIAFLCGRLQGLRPLLPRRAYAHLSGDAVATRATHYRVGLHRSYYNIALAGPARPVRADTCDAAALSAADPEDWQPLHRASYPGD